MANVDSQQIPRGSCEFDGCDCKQFVKGVDTPKCTGCKHAPVKHKALIPVPTSAPIVQQEAKATPNSVPPLIQSVPAQMSYHNQHMHMASPYDRIQPPPTDPYNQGYHMNMFPNMCAPGQQQQQQQQQFVLPPGQLVCGSCRCLYPEQSGACVVCHPRATCKICNANIVFMDLSMGTGLQVFDYCSPECRNKDLPRLDKEAGILQESS